MSRAACTFAGEGILKSVMRIVRPDILRVSCTLEFEGSGIVKGGRKVGLHMMRGCL